MHRFWTINEWIAEAEAKPIYIGVFFDDANRGKLLKQVPAQFSEVKADHVTLVYKDFSKFKKLGYKIGEHVEVTVTGHASDDGVQAVTVNTRSNNDNPHITISHSKDRKAVQSNDMLNRVKPDKMKLKIKGRVGVYMSDGTVSYEKDI